MKEATHSLISASAFLSSGFHEKKNDLDDKATKAVIQSLFSDRNTVKKDSRNEGKSKLPWNLLSGQDLVHHKEESCVTLTRHFETEKLFSTNYLKLMNNKTGKKKPQSDVNCPVLKLVSEKKRSLPNE